MELTPIKVPGKRSRDVKKGVYAINKSKPQPLATDLDRTKKRRRLKGLKKRRSMSPLEKLPVELLEKVFFDCLNLNLARSSPVIAGKLSSETTYVKTITKAFHHIWEQSDFTSTSRCQIEHTVKHSALQSAILRHRWATLEIILRSREVWLRRCNQSLENDKPSKFNTVRDLKYLDDLVVYDEHNPPQRVDGTMSLSKSLHIEFDSFSSYVDNAVPLQLLESFKMADGHRREVDDGCEIPNSLLLGPWSEEMLRYLYWLVKGQARTNSITSTSRELAITGMKTAISSGNLRAMWLLFWAGFHEDLQIDTLLWALQNAEGNKLAVISHLTRLLDLKHSELSFSWINQVLEKLEVLTEKARRFNDQERLEFLRDVERMPEMDRFLSGRGLNNAKQNHKRIKSQLDNDK